MTYRFQQDQIEFAFERNRVSAEDIDWFVLHYEPDGLKIGVDAILTLGHLRAFVDLCEEYEEMQKYDTDTDTDGE